MHESTISSTKTTDRLFKVVYFFSDYCDSSSNTKSRTTRPFKAITSGMIMKPLQYSGPIGDYETYRQTILSKINDSGKSTNQNMRRHGNSAVSTFLDHFYNL